MNTKTLKGLLAVATIPVLAGCADTSDQISASFVSPSPYQSMSCAQLGNEAQMVSNRVAVASAKQDKKASNDALAVGVGTILFWPALFMIKGDGAQAAEVARLKGEMEAIETTNRMKNCGIRFSG